MPAVPSRLARFALAGCVVATAKLASQPAHAFVPPNRRVEAPRSDMVYVPATSFHLLSEAKWSGPVPGGSTPASDPAGYLTHVGAFYIDRTEVTAGAYAECVAKGACPTLEAGDTMSPNHTSICTYGRAGLESHPVNCVTHVEATKFCAFLGKRLPTETEWELAARGTTGRPFPWGDEYPSPKHLNGCDASLQREAPKINETYTSMWGDTPDGDDGWAFTSPVGSYPAGASPYGVLDLAGNVEEWTSDPWWTPTASGPPSAPSASSTNDWVVRGGAWDLNSAESFSTTRRLQSEGGTRASWLGFRCARDA